MNAREIALKIINQVHVQEAYANVALTKELDKQTLSEQDRRFVTELVYGTVKTTGTLDWILGCYINRPLKKVSPMILDILRMGVYQIKYLDRVPDSAACNQSVELAKKYGHAGTVKFVNGVLRNIIRSPEKAEIPTAAKDAVKHIALNYNHPVWLVKRWLKSFGTEKTIKLCEFNNTSPQLCIRTNTLKISPDKLAEQLTKEGVEFVKSEFAPEGFACQLHPAMSKWQTLQAGLFQIQDESSMVVAHVLAPQPGETVMDVCSAPGGKTTHIAALMQNKGRVIAGDIYEHKLNRIRENIERLGINIVETVLMDAAEAGKAYPKQADRVLVDAPCSGLGVLRRKPDSRWKKPESILKELPQLQLQILEGAADAVKPGGVLVYSTCTIANEENASVVHSFLKQHSDFELEHTVDFLPGKKNAVAIENGAMVQFYQQEDGIDGFFLARMKRKNR